jgi:hypothetical protein
MDSNGILAIAAAVLLASAGSAAAGPNLVTNGDFSAGNTGFTTGYTLTTMTPDLFQNNDHGIYAVEPAGSIAGSSAYGDWTNISTDPTGHNGNVWVADGATDATLATVWSETVAVTPNTHYTFSFFGAEVSNPCCSNATLQASINGVNASTLDTTGAWQQDSFGWNSGSSTSAVLTLVDTNTSGGFNDFAIDDLSFSGPGVPEPAAWAMMLLGVGLIGGALRGRRSLALA